MNNKPNNERSLNSNACDRRQWQNNTESLFKVASMLQCSRNRRFEIAPQFFSIHSQRNEHKICCEA